MYKLIERMYDSETGNRPLLAPVFGFGYDDLSLADAKRFMVSDAKYFILAQCFENRYTSTNLKFKVCLNKKKNGIKVMAKTDDSDWYNVRDYEIVPK